MSKVQAGNVLGLLVIAGACGVCSLWSSSANRDGRTSSPEQVRAPLVVADPAPSGASPRVAPAGAGGAGAETPSRWRYHRSVDEMRGTETRTACITATNRLEFQFPYQGGSTAELCLRQKGRTFDVFVAVSRGQLICHLGDCPIALKVDDGAVIEVGGDPPDSAAHDMAFLRRGSTVRQKLLRARRFVVEATFYRDGARQMVFEGAQGLIWPPPADQ